MNKQISVHCQKHKITLFIVILRASICVCTNNNNASYMLHNRSVSVNEQHVWNSWNSYIQLLIFNFIASKQAWFHIWKKENKKLKYETKVGETHDHWTTTIERTCFLVDWSRDVKVESRCRRYYCESARIYYHVHLTLVRSLWTYIFILHS